MRPPCVQAREITQLRIFFLNPNRLLPTAQTGGSAVVTDMSVLACVVSPPWSLWLMSSRPATDKKSLFSVGACQLS